jgi:phosphatidylserine/phosphatidylglycerophosphate/cardiolipin synthase-like enzyme
MAAPPRISLRLDREHPIYAAHHQKIVFIDDALAFAGGIDLTVGRWDTSDHGADDPAGLTPDGSAYGPVHDLQMVVNGDAARALGDLAHRRWRDATGEALQPVNADADLWHVDLKPDFMRIPVGIARTTPGWGGEPSVREAAALTVDALSAARRSIYIEAQYLASFAIGDLLAERLAMADGPEIVILLPQSMPGLLERFAMGSNRDRLIRRMKQADRFDRLRIYRPVVPAR